MPIHFANTHHLATRSVPGRSDGSALRCRSALLISCKLTWDVVKDGKLAYSSSVTLRGVMAPPMAPPENAMASPLAEDAPPDVTVNAANAAAVDATSLPCPPPVAWEMCRAPPAGPAPLRLADAVILAALCRTLSVLVRLRARFTSSSVEGLRVAGCVRWWWCGGEERGHM